MKTYSIVLSRELPFTSSWGRRASSLFLIILEGRSSLIFSIESTSSCNSEDKLSLFWISGVRSPYIKKPTVKRMLCSGTSSTEIKYRIVVIYNYLNKLFGHPLLKGIYQKKIWNEAINYRFLLLVSKRKVVIFYFEVELKSLTLNYYLHFSFY